MLHDLITGLSLVRKINILLGVYKTEKLYILHARHDFFRGQDFLNFLFFKYIRV